VSVSPLTGLNRIVAVRESRALPWPNMFDAFGVSEIGARERDVGDRCQHLHNVGKRGPEDRNYRNRPRLRVGLV
jgi:hypothetical protein